jgi:hypothetical protein
MSKHSVATESIYGFAPERADVSPEEPIFVLSSTQLHEIINAATKSLNSRIDVMEDRIAQLEGDKAKIEALEKDQNILSDNQLIQLRLINDLRHKEPGKTELSRAEKLAKYLEARPDHKATFETLKGYLGIDNTRLKETILTLMNASPGRYGITTQSGDKRKRVLVMLSK